MSLPDPPPKSSWPIELLDEAERFGNPEAVFSTAKGTIGVTFISGIACIALGIIANIVYWLALDNPQPAGKTTIGVLVIVPALIPIAGIGFLLSGLRNKGVWELVYRDRLLHWRRGEVEEFRWKEIRSITFSGVQTFGAPEIERDEDDRIVRAWLPIQANSLVSWRLNPIRKDEERAFIPEQISESSELCRLIQEKTFELAWPRALKCLRDHNEREFGLISLSQEGLISDKDSRATVKLKLLRWEAIGTIKTENSLQISKKINPGVRGWLSICGTYKIPTFFSR